MKLLVTAEGKELESNIDPRFGRAQWFLLIDTEDGLISAHDNSDARVAMQGAGIQAASCAIGLKPDAIISGNIGPKAFTALSQAGIKIFIGASGSVSDAIKAFKNGKLKEAQSPNVQGHWG